VNDMLVRGGASKIHKKHKRVFEFLRCFMCLLVAKFSVCVSLQGTTGSLSGFAKSLWELSRLHLGTHKLLLGFANSFLNPCSSLLGSEKSQVARRQSHPVFRESETGVRISCLSIHNSDQLFAGSGISTRRSPEGLV
jgi:hypothetical protein